ncbi:MAG: hypothetical protein M1820_006088 [Bogoriella megaspora]|nr:MAG: hypothetical protein M1820_006088 [Bogoriella megaspora]
MMLSTSLGALLLASVSLSSAKTIPDRSLLVEKRAAADLEIVKRVTTTTASPTSSSTSSSIVLEGVKTTRTAAHGPKSSAIAPDCQNGPGDRKCWDGQYDITTNYYNEWPVTGETKNFYLKVTNSTCNPDGNGPTRYCLRFNDTIPGPTIRANWGDQISITVENGADVNGTSVHWHGVRQLNSNTEDGVNGITECPLAPHKTKTYSFLATQYGTSWYHSHYSVQYGNGLIGPLIIDGPATANYDEDLGPLVLGDWWYQDAFVVEQVSDDALNNVSQPGPAPQSNVTLVNGTMKTAGKGEYHRTTLNSGKKHRLRLINTSVDAQLRVALEGHTMEVIAADFVPVTNYTTDHLLIGIGQRYDVIITADQTPGDYWFYANAAGDCASSTAQNGLSIFSYSNTTAGTPTGPTTTALPTNGCQGEEISPYVAINVDKSTFLSQVQELTVSINTPGVKYVNSSVAAWGINTSNVDVQWGKPTLQFVEEKNGDYPQGYNVVQIPNEGVWTYWVVQEVANNLPNNTAVVPIPHPLHLHGHDFWVLGSKAGATFDASTDTDSLNFTNPPRRDVTFLPAGGWTIMAFYSDNPGAWLMHCHIAFHVSAGLAMQFVESNSTIPAPDAAWHQTCDEWNDYYEDAEYKQTDSGL